VSLPVRTTPEADAQIRTIDKWWRENRTASPNLFAAELAAALDLLAPHIGRPYRQSAVLDTHVFCSRYTALQILETYIGIGLPCCGTVVRVGGRT
jgi:hypothetical protein